MTSASTTDQTVPASTAAEWLVRRAAHLLEGLTGPGLLELRAVDGAVAEALQGPDGTVWRRLLALFALNPAEADLLAMAVAVAAEPALGPKVAQAQGQVQRYLPGEPLIKRLHGHAARPIWRPTSPLAVWGLLEAVPGLPGEPVGYAVDPRVLDWLFGVISLDASLCLGASPLAAEPVPAEWPVAATARRLDQALRSGNEVRLLIEARDGSGRTRFAAAVAQALRRSALLIDPEVLRGDSWPQAFMRAQRFALVADMALVWRPGGPAWPRTLPLAPLQLLCVDEGQAPPPRPGAADITVALAEPGVATKAQLLRTWAPQLQEDAAQLAATPGLTLSDLAEAARTAPASTAQALEHLRARSRARLQGAGQVIDPVLGWDDLVLAPALTQQLQRIAFEARARPSLLDDAETRRVFPGGAGLAVLFAGPPGVGKSMAAQVIARELGINLLRIDLAATTSKYIGETAKNLSAAFAAARSAGAALLFEEADALFAKRSEVKDSNDRHANADTNHLLHLMEVSAVRAFLTTNRRGNIDPAFLRRLHHVVQFERPGPVERLRLWTTVLKVLGVHAERPPGALTEAVGVLAQTCDLSPAQIKDAALSAWFTARQAQRALSIADLQHAVSHEMAKEGRAPMTPAQRPPRRPSLHHGELTHG